MPNSLVTVNMISREAVQLFVNSNAFLSSIAAEGGGTVYSGTLAPAVSLPAAAAMGVAAAVIQNPPVTRRFWDPRTWLND